MGRSCWHRLLCLSSIVLDHSARRKDSQTLSKSVLDHGSLVYECKYLAAYSLLPSGISKR